MQALKALQVVQSCRQAKGSAPAFSEHLFCAWQRAGAISSILQVSKLRFRKRKWLAPGHTAGCLRVNLKQFSALLEVLVSWGKHSYQPKAMDL